MADRAGAAPGRGSPKPLIIYKVLQVVRERAGAALLVVRERRSPKTEPREHRDNHRRGVARPVPRCHIITSEPGRAQPEKPPRPQVAPGPRRRTNDRTGLHRAFLPTS